MPDRAARYNTESALVADLIGHVKAMTQGGWVTEFDYQRGRTDLVMATTDGEIWAFEAKLTRWRDALSQAYRNTCFAHQSFVVLPPEVAARVARFDGDFRRHGVGLCTVTEKGVVVLLAAKMHREPLQPALAREAASRCSSGLA